MKISGPFYSVYIKFYLIPITSFYMPSLILRVGDSEIKSFYLFICCVFVLVVVPLDKPTFIV